MTDEMQITGAQIDDDGKLLGLRVSLHNPADRTLHAYATVRALRYDLASRVLEVQLSDRGLAEPFGHKKFIRPRFTSIDPGGDSVLELSVPRVILRLGRGLNPIAPRLERRPAYEARYVDIELAWATTPFYPDPRRTATGPRGALVAWAKGFARHRHERRPPSAR